MRKSKQISDAAIENDEINCLHKITTLIIKLLYQLRCDRFYTYISVNTYYVNA